MKKRFRMAGPDSQFFFPLHFPPAIAAGHPIVCNGSTHAASLPRRWSPFRLF